MRLVFHCPVMTFAPSNAMHNAANHFPAEQKDLDRSVYFFLAASSSSLALARFSRLPA